MAEQQNKQLKSSKKQTPELKGEVIGGRIPYSMYEAILPFLLEVISDMYKEEEEKNRHDRK